MQFSLTRGLCTRPRSVDLVRLIVGILSTILISFSHMHGEKMITIIFSSIEKDSNNIHLVGLSLSLNDQIYFRTHRVMVST